MDNSYAGNAAVYLISTVFSIYIALVMLRLLLQLVRADFHNPLSQFIAKATNAPVGILRRFIPSIRGVDLASVVLLLGLQMLMLWLILLASGRAIPISGLVVISAADLISLVLNIYLIAIIAQIILSWVGPPGQNPIVSVLHSLTEPVMRPARRILPPMSGVDLSPMVAILAIQLLKILIVAPIADLGRSLGYN